MQDFKILSLIHEPTFLILAILVLLILISLSTRVRKLEERLEESLKVINNLKNKIEKDLKDDEELKDVIDQFLSTKENREIIKTINKEKRIALEMDTLED